MSTKTILETNYNSDDSSSDFKPSDNSDSSSDESSEENSSENEEPLSGDDIYQVKLENSDGETCDFDIPDDIKKSNVDDNKETVTDSDKNKICNLPLMMRKSFPFCFLYFLNDEDELEELKQKTIDTVKKLFDVEDVDIYLIQGNKEKDRLRVICPNIHVNISIAKDLRSLILRDLGYKFSSNKIPVLMYEAPSSPIIFMCRLWDMGLNKWETYQSYYCLNNKNLKTEQIEKLLIKWNETDEDISNFTEEYNTYLSLSVEGEPLILENDKLVSVILDDKNISDDIKKEIGNNFEKCIEWFKKYHPDTSLRAIKKLNDDRFHFDFTKSKNKCRLCDLIHLSNRQYLTYSKNNEKVFYHCYDNDANGKHHVISFKKRKETNIITV